MTLEITISVIFKIWKTMKKEVLVQIIASHFFLFSASTAHVPMEGTDWGSKGFCAGSSTDITSVRPVSTRDLWIGADLKNQASLVISCSPA